MFKLFSLPLLALGLAACATQNTAGAPAGRDCFAASTVSGYNVLDDHHVRVIAGPSRNYVFGTTWNARDLIWSERIAIRSNPGGWICTGNGLGVEVFGGRPRRVYPITDISREPPPPATGR